MCFNVTGLARKSFNYLWGLPYMKSAEKKGEGSRNDTNLRTNSIDFADKERGEGLKISKFKLETPSQPGYYDALNNPFKSIGQTSFSRFLGAYINGMSAQMLSLYSPSSCH